jgi:hypothetical protein
LSKLQLNSHKHNTTTGIWNKKHFKIINRVERKTKLFFHIFLSRLKHQVNEDFIGDNVKSTVTHSLDAKNYNKLVGCVQIHLIPLLSFLLNVNSTLTATKLVKLN